MYRIVQVPDDAADLPEVLGTKPKFWYEDEQGRKTLYKEGRPDSGEHWAEKICCEISRVLGLPHADYELAQWRGRKGVVTPSFVPEGARLVLGNELLARAIPGYEGVPRFKARQHTVRVVMAVLNHPAIRLPAGFAGLPGVATPADAFVGYVMLDALVGNQDRHHENWGLVLIPTRQITLAPTFDHASSLGRNERDEERVRRLATRDRGSSIEKYVERARSAFYLSPASTQPLSTLAAFHEAARIRPSGAAAWRDRLRGARAGEFEQIVEAVPASEMSGPARQFALRMIEVNRLRLIA
jgi:hypothetical protein